MVTTRPSLLERIRDGEQDAWREFEALYNPLLVGVCKRSGLSDADTSDVVQETLMGVHQTFAALEGQFDRSKRRFRDWLRRVTKNKVIDLIRRRRLPLVLDGSLGTADATQSDVEAMIDEEWRRHTLDRALRLIKGEVSPVKYQAFDLYVMKGQPPKKVARLLGVTRNVVFMSKCQVLARMRAIVAEIRRQEDQP